MYTRWRWRKAAIVSAMASTVFVVLNRWKSGRVLPVRRSDLVLSRLNTESTTAACTNTC